MRASLVKTAIAVSFAVALCSPALTRPPRAGEVELPKPPEWAGEYRNAASPDQRLVLEGIGAAETVRVRTSEGWGAVGFLSGDHFEGVLRSADMQGSPLPGPFGTLTFDIEPGRSLSVTVRRGADVVSQKWLAAVHVSGDLPKFGDYVYVEELPAAIRKPAPAYPPAARRAGIQGTVMVQALVGRDGAVHDTRIVKSIPELDKAALGAVRQWKFKPALSKGSPVAVWVAVPVKFTLK